MFNKKNFRWDKRRENQKGGKNAVINEYILNTHMET